MGYYSWEPKELRWNIKTYGVGELFQDGWENKKTVKVLEQKFVRTILGASLEEEWREVPQINNVNTSENG